MTSGTPARIDGYELYLPESLKAYERVVRKPPLPKCLYHYTTPAAAVAIIRSATIWATNVRSMNDTSELTYAEGVISEVVDSEASILSGMPQRWLREFAGALHRTLERTTNFAACFCEQGDALSQWRGYGGDDAVSLGFTASALASIDGGTVARVEYDPNTQREAVRETIRIHVKGFRRAVRWRDEHRIVELSGMLSFQLALWAAVLKHPSYVDEREWRYIPLAYEANDVRRRPSRDEDNTYIEIHLANPGLGGATVPLEAVVLSPLSDARPSEEKLSATLSDIGHRATVGRSQIPYRIPDAGRERRLTSV